ncbi:MAG: hypothetical protein IPI03_17375 [Rubrivivax sp.]|nr:hypothetical protein [Rubrivivax sp.]MBK7263530.1 hypothetical protein [Rubrivivax sp.]MBK8525638.1 hypothetical protein [Rubrivivax sp.]
MFRCAALGLLALTLLSTAQAQVPRLFPAHALRGEITGTAPPDVLLNGRPARLAPGARIRNQENRFDLISQIAGQKLVVNYTLEAGGMLLEIWILTPSEQANRPWPATREQAQTWTFDPIAQAWTRP